MEGRAVTTPRSKMDTQRMKLVEEKDSPIIEVMSSDEEEEMINSRKNSNEKLQKSTLGFSCYHCNEKFKDIVAVFNHTKQIPVEEMKVSINRYTRRVLQNRNNITPSPSRQPSINKKKNDKAKLHCRNCEYSTTQPYLLRCHLFLNHNGLKPNSVKMTTKDK